MKNIVSITSQGQLTIPKKIREHFGIQGAVKAIVRMQDQKIIVEQETDFWSLSAVGRGKIALSDTALKKARKEFAKRWPRKSGV